MWERAVHVGTQRKGGVGVGSEENMSMNCYLRGLICIFIMAKVAGQLFMCVQPFFRVWRNVYLDPCLYFGMSCLFIPPLWVFFICLVFKFMCMFMSV